MNWRGAKQWSFRGTIKTVMSLPVRIFSYLLTRLGYFARYTEGESKWDMDEDGEKE